MADIHSRISYLEQFITEQRRETMMRVLDQRTRFVTVVLEDIYQPHNASAVLRTCDCFGVQDVHIIENRNRYRINPDVELGTAQWLTLHRYNRRDNNTPEAIAELRRRGYRIVATTPHGRTVSLDEFRVADAPTAVLLGNELEGLSETALDAADERLRIPMYGFVESFNISVSAAIILNTLCSTLRRDREDWTLSGDEREEILLGWLRRSIKRSVELEREWERTGSHEENPTPRVEDADLAR